MEALLQVDKVAEMAGAVLVLVLVVGANFLGPTLGCGLQQTLNESMFAKHVFLFLMLLFTLSLYGDEETDPTTQIWYAGMLYVLYIVVSSMSFRYVSAVVVLLVLLFQTNRYGRYYKKKFGDIPSSSHGKNVHNVQLLLLVLLAVVVSIGVPAYYREQRADHAQDFSMLKFVFGTVKCDHDKSS